MIFGDHARHSAQAARGDRLTGAVICEPAAPDGQDVLISLRPHGTRLTPGMKDFWRSSGRNAQPLDKRVLRLALGPWCAAGSVATPGIGEADFGVMPDGRLGGPLVIVGRAGSHVEVAAV